MSDFDEIIRKLDTPSSSDELGVSVRSIPYCLINTPAILSRLARLSVHPDARVRWNAAHILCYGKNLGDVIEILLPMLSDADEGVCREAWWAIVGHFLDGFSGSVRKAPLVRHLAHIESRFARQCAVNIISRTDAVNPEHFPVLFQLAADPDVNVRASAIDVLAYAPTVPVDSLVPFLKDLSRGIRYGLTFAFGERGSVARHVLADFCELLDDPDEHVRFFAARAVVKIDPTCERPIPVLSKALTRASNAEYPRLAREALRQMSPPLNPEDVH